MEIYDLPRHKLMDTLREAYQITCCYDNTCEKVYLLQQKMLPEEKPEYTQPLQGKFGGGFGFAVFLVSTFCIGMRFQGIVEILLAQMGWKNELTRFLVSLSAIVPAMLGVTVLA
jgi:hypothetical protein